MLTIPVRHELGGTAKTTPVNFSEATKSEVFISSAFSTSLKCPLCSGYLDPEKSISYDHVIRKREGGKGSQKTLK
jgi:hypothetical protein